MNVLVYAGPGTSAGSVRHTIRSLKLLLSNCYDVQPVEPAVLSAPSSAWKEATALLVIPGGRDLPYVQHLSPAGTESIMDYVKSGGSYLGFCAGAYFACGSVDFCTHLHCEDVSEADPLNRIQGSRDLGFFSGTAYGSVTPKFAYNSEQGSHAVTISLNPDSTQTFNMSHAKDLDVYVNGGPFFKVDAPSKDIETLCWYTSLSKEPKSAIVQCRVEKGMAVLCGPHIEYDARLIASHLAQKDLTDALSRESRERLEEILPELIKSDNDRIDLLRNILVRLGLKVNASSDFDEAPESPVFHLSLVKDDNSNLPNMESLELEPTKPIQDSLTLWGIVSLHRHDSKSYCKSDHLEIVRCTLDDLQENRIPKTKLNLQKYITEWNRARSAGQMDSYSSRAGSFGSAIMYGDVVSSTKTLLEK